LFFNKALYKIHKNVVTLKIAEEAEIFVKVDGEVSRTATLIQTLICF